MTKREEVGINREINALVKRFEEEDLSESLDVVIHSLKSNEGSVINNGGPASQVEYMIESYGADSALRMLKDIAANGGLNS